MEKLRSEIWDLVYLSGPRTVSQIADKLGLDQVTVDGVVDHQWFLRRGETVFIATSEGTSDGKKPNDF